MSLPFFLKADLAAAGQTFVLDENTSRHIVQVLRMQAGSQLNITDGMGSLYRVAVTDADKKKCGVEVIETGFQQKSAERRCVAISPLKNASRFEWFLEKATEIGITDIVPLMCARTEKQHLRLPRLNGIITSAMLQSQRVWLPVLHEPVQFMSFVSAPDIANDLKCIAHCSDDNQTSFAAIMKDILRDTAATVLIGPEGDFTKEEIDKALSVQFLAVTLGEKRLRTETAALVAATLLCIR